MLRKTPDTFHGSQVLVDHRTSGSIGGLFGNGIGSFHAVPFALDAVYDGDIAFEVHDNDPLLGLGRWGHDAACRWRTIRIKKV
ncbi:MAG: hypothetical protein R2710_31125 [Acidimicrobiales bacterium]